MKIWNELISRPVLIAGCSCTLILGAAFGTILPFIVYLAGYLIIAPIINKKAVIDAERVGEEEDDTEYDDAFKTQEDEMIENVIENTVYTCIDVAGIFVILAIIILVIYRVCIKSV